MRTSPDCQMAPPAPRARPHGIRGLPSEGSRSLLLGLLALLLLPALPVSGEAQEARARWDRLCTIRQDKFDLVLPEAMRENNIQMWIVVQREGHNDPLYEDLGRGYTGDMGYYIFTDRGSDRIERAAFGIGGRMLSACPTYDIIQGSVDLKAFVTERNPRRIGVNMSSAIGAADGLSHTEYIHLVETLGPELADRLVSAEKLVSDFRSRRVASEIVAFGDAAEITRRIWERALSNEVITPGVTALEDVAWWIWDRILEQGLQSSFDMPSVYITGPEGIEDSSSERIIQRGDLLMIDGGVCYLNFCPDMKRTAYVLQEGEGQAPASYRHALEQATRVREVIRRNIRAGRTAAETLDLLAGEVEAVDGFRIMPGFNQPYRGESTDVIIVSHSVGNLGHGVGPSIAYFNPKRLTYEIRPTNLFSIEFFAYTPIPEWGGAKLRIPYEDDAVVTDRGVEWLYPLRDRILLIR
ncbi:MAG: M24 family metallopeptidase [Gemmatimonadota bacterium]